MQYTQAVAIVPLGHLLGLLSLSPYTNMVCHTLLDDLALCPLSFCQYSIDSWLPDDFTFKTVYKVSQQQTGTTLSLADELTQHKLHLLMGP